MLLTQEKELVKCYIVNKQCFYHNCTPWVILVNQTESSKPVKRDGMKRIVGLIAVALILVLTALAILHFLSPIEWIVAEVIIALIANIIFRMVDKRGNK